MGRTGRWLLTRPLDGRTPNVSRFLIRWGVADIIGDGLVECKSLRSFNNRGELVQHTDLARTKRDYGFPWWAVHRAQLHAGLVEAARRHGVEIHVGSRVASITYDTSPVQIATTSGQMYDFDLLVGADGLKSTTRRILFPDVKPYPVTANAAYRATVPYERVFQEVPEARDFLSNSVDTYLQPGSYAIFYPLKGGKELNIVLSHMATHKVWEVEDVDIRAVQEQYKDHHPVVRKLIGLISHTQRWPLMQVFPMQSWSSPNKNVVLLGDAAHAMENHLAQGAATAIEDGAFLGRALQDVLHGYISLAEMVEIYEKARMPRAWMKQQGAFLTGCLLLLPDEERSKARDAAFKAVRPRESIFPETEPTMGPDPGRWSWDLYTNPDTIPSVSGYDAESDADFAVQKFLSERREAADPETNLSPGLERKWTSHFFPASRVGEFARLRA